MSQVDFITNLLNVNDNDIENIDTHVQSDYSIHVYIKLKAQKNILCPFCEKKVISHGFKTRKLKHSTLVNRNCILFFKQRRYLCKYCDTTFSEQNPFSNTKENLTYETKINILNDLKYPSNTYASCARRYNVSPTQVLRVFDKHVNIKRKQLTNVISIDEHYFPNSDHDGKYILLIMDFTTGTMLDVLPDRKKDELIRYFSGIKNKTFNPSDASSELDNVKYVSIDMNDNYRSICKTYFTDAIICADSFHVIKQLTNAFKNVRLKYQRKTKDEKLAYLFRKFKRVFNSGFELDNEGKYNKVYKRVLNYRDILNILLNAYPELKKAYELKERYILFNQTVKLETAKEELSELIELFADSNIEEYIPFYNLLINWNEEIINSFSMPDKKRINNSYIESKNRRIETLLFNANGMSNFKRTRNRILYCLNKDDKFTL